MLPLSLASCQKMSTIIRIKYTESIGHQTDEATNPSRNTSDHPTINRDLLVNVNCNMGLVVNYIREAVRSEPTGEIDLCEESTGRPMNISSQKPNVSGLNIFQSNHTYLLVIVERDANGQIVNYVPMIDKRLSRTLSETVAKIKRLSKKSSAVMIKTSKISDRRTRKSSPQGKSK